jgi:hypothetical protein
VEWEIFEEAEVGVCVKTFVYWYDLDALSVFVTWVGLDLYAKAGISCFHRKGEQPLGGLHHEFSQDPKQPRGPLTHEGDHESDHEPDYCGNNDCARLKMSLVHATNGVEVLKRTYRHILVIFGLTSNSVGKIARVGSGGG